MECQPLKRASSTYRRSAHIVLYQKNIEAVCSNEAEVRHEIRQTLIHELGHYFGMTEEPLKDV